MSELSLTFLAEKMQKIRQAAFVSSSRFAVEKNKKKKIMTIAKLFALHANAKIVDLLNGITFAISVIF